MVAMNPGTRIQAVTTVADVQNDLRLRNTRWIHEMRRGGKRDVIYIIFDDRPRDKETDGGLQLLLEL